jgi:hypothetical protein
MEISKSKTFSIVVNEVSYTQNHRLTCRLR